MAKTLDVARSTILYNLEKKDSTDELMNIKSPERPWKTAAVDEFQKNSFPGEENPLFNSWSD